MLFCDYPSDSCACVDLVTTTHKSGHFSESSFRLALASLAAAMSKLRPKVNNLFEGDPFSEQSVEAASNVPAVPSANEQHASNNDASASQRQHGLFQERLAIQRNITTPFLGMPRLSSSTATSNPYTQFDPRLSKRLSISLDDLYALGFV